MGSFWRFRFGPFVQTDFRLVMGNYAIAHDTDKMTVTGKELERGSDEFEFMVTPAPK